ncbi:GNAT family N-acetyltransferase [Sporosarcina thermotolerans]|uniref:GNAT family N-acetyltransferase n=1 Tax=Sporosarcina thermotolerans TaxID=633404 RepID=A0AAW9A6B8_9BACL|nr:GNAT family N-acetyltransferase [Sporosarcina thermotolerans]MDW0116677.1 GNAT family N-acetyltransferase [Sporosarcina thermotolerans]WHT48874.1 GNAT family N-acetyltransferase [Sporosarcina thermotolerans]
MVRNATQADLDFLIRIDLKNDGYTVSDRLKLTDQEKMEHSKKIEQFLISPDKGAFIIDDSVFSEPIAMVMFSVANRDTIYPWKTIFNELDRNLFQSDGRFIEIFQLWVHPSFRRLGLATKLKLKLEEEAYHREIDVIYTHTEENSHHVIELNEKIGYQEVRRGPIWDDISRVSLIKKLKRSLVQ